MYAFDMFVILDEHQLFELFRRESGQELTALSFCRSIRMGNIRSV